MEPRGAKTRSRSRKMAQDSARRRQRAAQEAHPGLCRTAAPAAAAPTSSPTTPSADMARQPSDRRRYQCDQTPSKVRSVEWFVNRGSQTFSNGLQNVRQDRFNLRRSMLELRNLICGNQSKGNALDGSFVAIAKGPQCLEPISNVTQSVATTHQW